MKKIKAALIISLLSGFMLFSVGCEDATETANKVAGEVEEAVQVEATKNNEFVLSVKEGSLSNYPNTRIEDAFANLFSSPKWKYFKADTGQDVVEFTGYCMFSEQKVKAKMQFLVSKDSDNFEIGSLAFNDVPQDELTKAALLAAIYEEPVVGDNAPDPRLAGNDTYYIGKAMSGYMVELDTETIGDIFDESRFANPIWSVTENGDVIFNGDYKGEIFPGEGSKLEFLLVSQGDDTYYSIASLKYNGQEVPKENHYIILDIIS